MEANIITPYEWRRPLFQGFLEGIRHAPTCVSPVAPRKTTIESKYYLKNKEPRGFNTFLRYLSQVHQEGIRRMSQLEEGVGLPPREAKVIEIKPRYDQSY